MLAPSTLSAVDWQLCVATAGSGGERGQSAHSILELALTTQQPAGAAPLPTAAAGAASAAGATTDATASAERKIHLRIGKEGMTELLGKLDKIQQQIDKLS